MSTAWALVAVEGNVIVKFPGWPTTVYPVMGAADARHVRAACQVTVNSGALVAGTQSGSPAASAGMGKCDVIVNVDGKNVATTSDLNAAMFPYHPLEKVLVVVEDAGKSVLTDAEGRFRIEGLPPGPHRLYVSVVGYSLFRREVSAADALAPLTVRLSEGTTAYSENVTVTPDVFRAPPDPVPSSQVLGSAELHTHRPDVHAVRNPGLARMSLRNAHARAQARRPGRRDGRVARP